MLQVNENIQLYTKDYLVENARASVLLIHGLGEYSDRYAHVAQALNAAQVNVYTFDLRGHGHSGGTKALIKDMAEYREDTTAVYEQIPKNMPLFVIGHSMGGLIAVDFLLSKKRSDVAGVVLSGAALELGTDITPFTQTAVRWLAKLSSNVKTVKLDANKISRDPETVKLYQTDPLIYRDGTKAGLAVALLDGIIAQKKRFKELDYPVLIMHGEGDTITNPAGSQALYNQAKSADKTLKLWPEAYHEIFNEINRAEIISTTVRWITDRL